MTFRCSNSKRCLPNTCGCAEKNLTNSSEPKGMFRGAADKAASATAFACAKRRNGAAFGSTRRLGISFLTHEVYCALMTFRSSWLWAFRYASVMWLGNSDISGNMITGCGSKYEANDSTTSSMFGLNFGPADFSSLAAMPATQLRKSKNFLQHKKFI